MPGLQTQSGQWGSSGLEAPEGQDLGFSLTALGPQGHARPGGPLVMRHIWWFPNSVVYNPVLSFSVNTSFLFMQTLPCVYLQHPCLVQKMICVAWAFGVRK